MNKLLRIQAILARIYQINVQLPEGLAAGSATSVRLNYLNRPSSEVTLAVQ